MYDLASYIRSNTFTHETIEIRSYFTGVGDPGRANSPSVPYNDRMVPPTASAERAPLAGPAHEPAPAAPAGGYSGEVVYLYAFDLAYETMRRPIPELLGQRTAEFVVDSSKRAPRQLLFYRPQVVRLPPTERLGPRGPMRLERAIKILPVGAISITVRVPFHVRGLDELVQYHDLRFSDGTYLYDVVRELAEEARRELQPYLIRPNDRLGDEEAYTIFCMSPPLPAPALAEGETPWSAERWLADNRRQVAALLTEEADPRRLSDQEAEESTGKHLS
jgi:hypothetical protein